MVRRPPGHVAQQRKYLVAFAALLAPWLLLAHAQQQHPSPPPPPPPHLAVPPLSQEPSNLRSPILAENGVPHPPATSLTPPLDGDADDDVRRRRKNTVSSPSANEQRRDNIYYANLPSAPYGEDGKNEDTRQNQAKHNHDPPHDHPPILPSSDASAVDNTPALDLSVRAPPPPSPPRRRAAAEIASPQAARSLDDWEVEDFVVLATVDGDLYASDRKTGALRWRLEVEQPMVETRHFRTNRSVLDDDYSPVDHYLWLVEPNRDGDLYLWVPQRLHPPRSGGGGGGAGAGAGLVRMGYTVKELVENLTPYADKEQNILYIGDKKTTLVTLDAATGRVLQWFGSGGSHINEMERCLKPNALADLDAAECSGGGGGGGSGSGGSTAGTLTLGRTEYSVRVEYADGRGTIATLRYAEWGPNTYDNDLLKDYHVTMDRRYVTGRPDGQLYGFDYARFDDGRPLFAQRLASPVARVFDVARPWGAPADSNPELVVLPQPPPPPEDAAADRLRRESIFINRTETGSWYAMSGRSYPLILHAPPAQITNQAWWDMQQSLGALSEAQISQALVGTHMLDPTVGRGGRGRGGSGLGQTPLLIGDGSSTAAGGGAAAASGGQRVEGGSGGGAEEDADGNSSIFDKLPGGGGLAADASAQDGTLMNAALRLPEVAAHKVLDLVSNPVLILLFVFALFYYQQDLRRWYNREVKRRSSVDSDAADVAPESSDPKQLPPGEQRVEKDVRPSRAEPDDGDKAAPAALVDRDGGASPPVPFADGVATHDDAADRGTPAPDAGDGAGGEPEKKKKAHRGRRAGVKHKKGRNRCEFSQSRDDEHEPAATVEEVVDRAKQLGEQPRLEPDIQTVTGDPQEVSGPILKMGPLEVNEDQQLGTGSNGTVVFAGKWDGRDVAVKRMLIQFNEIASQETRLLRESDDHPNVIRYFAQQQRAAFLYIALELCQASLADVVQKPHLYRELAQAGERDLPGVLYQVANGIHHLHSLRIVHRDLKPQNILVNMGKDGRPRVLVSDFGLCKKLEGGQSSFGATTAHAAGTSGWRAPELLLDDDGPATQTDPGSASLPSGGDGGGGGGSHTGSALADGGPELFGPHNRRVTRAIDIFSMGLVFFYVLTKGNHPFDCGDRYMREVNIRKGRYNLQPLDALGDFAYEARDLIASMLRANPRERPSARDVMAHPFFWPAKKRLSFLCDVSDHFEKEPRDPPSEALRELERWAPATVKGDFLRHLPKEFVDSLGKQRKYTGTKMLDLLRALRNKRNHYEDMPESLKKAVGPLPDGYLGFWTRRFPNLLIACWNVVYNVQWDDTDRFREYYEPAGL